MNEFTHIIRVVLADDHPIVLHAIADAFSKCPGYAIATTASSGAELLRALSREPADLLVTDLVMQSGDRDGPDGLRLIGMVRRSYPELPLVVFTMITSAGMFSELCKLSVAAIVSKEETTETLTQICVGALASTETIVSPKIRRRIAEDGATTHDLARAKPLSPRELEVVRLFAQGISVTEIAKTLNRSVTTVATQKRAAMRKLHVDNHVDLVKYATETGLV